MSKANDRQVGGEHYKSEYQHWDFADDVNMHHLEYIISKWVTRYQNKGGAEDLEKALHALEKLRDLRNAHREALEEFSALNRLHNDQFLALDHLLNGRYKKCEVTIRRMLAEEKQSTEPGPSYVTGGYIDGKQMSNMTLDDLAD